MDGFIYMFGRNDYNIKKKETSFTLYEQYVMYVLLWGFMFFVLMFVHTCIHESNVFFDYRIRYFWFHSIQENSESCSICLEEMKQCSPVRKLQCGHTFHPSCINNWLIFSRSAKCPLCQTNHKLFFDKEKVMQ